jgi:uncharacterized protein YjbI with pentapeptide repeats
MSDGNPHRRIARIIAFGCYVIAGLVLVVSIPFVLAAATMDLTKGPMPMENVTNTRMVIMIGSTFTIITLMIVLFGWRVQRIFGQHRRQEKLAAKSAVGCLRLGSLGCGLWALPSTFGVLISGQLLATGEPAGLQDIFIASSMFVIAIILMMSSAWFISTNFASLNSEERKHIYQAYLNLVQPRLSAIADPETRAYIQDQTIAVLPKLDTTLKSALLEALSKSKLLTGNTRIDLSKVDFRRIDLTTSSLPHADLREINLEEAKLRGAMLFRVNLCKANLRKTDLSRARLQAANLRQADLTDAVLKEAKLRGANLAETILTRADLSEANLQGANLQGANLREANLAGAMLKETDLRGADLTLTIVTPDQLRQAKY